MALKPLGDRVIVKADEVEAQTASGLYLGRWLYRQQKAQRDGTLRQDRKDRLDAVTPAWNPESQLSSESLPLKGKVSASSHTG